MNRKWLFKNFLLANQGKVTSTLLKFLPKVFGPPLPMFLAFAAFIRRIFASILFVLGAFEPINFPDPVFPLPLPGPICPKENQK